MSVQGSRNRQGGSVALLPHRTGARSMRSATLSLPDAPPSRNLPSGPAQPARVVLAATGMLGQAASQAMCSVAFDSIWVIRPIRI